MANQEHLRILGHGVDTWNQWRKENNVSNPDLRGANLIRAQLSRAVLMGAQLSEADLRGANLSKAHLLRADLRGANLQKANLQGAKLIQANLSGANLSEADLSKASLISSILIETDFQRAILSNCSVYGISAWNLNLDGAEQSDLVITRPTEPSITVDNLEVAQFIYLLLNNKRIRDVIDTVSNKVVLILGRFTPERKAVLDALRNILRTQHNHLPVLFDFDKPASRNLTETVSTLAHMAHFVIADITDAKSVPQELQRIVPDLPSVPIQPILLVSESYFGMFEDFLQYPSVLPPHLYKSQEDLLSSLEEKVIAPVVAKSRMLEEKRIAIRKALEREMRQ